MGHLGKGRHCIFVLQECKKHLICWKRLDLRHFYRKDHNISTLRLSLWLSFFLLGILAVSQRKWHGLRSDPTLDFILLCVPLWSRTPNTCFKIKRMCKKSRTAHSDSVTQWLTSFLEQISANHANHAVNECRVGVIYEYIFACWGIKIKLDLDRGQKRIFSPCTSLALTGALFAAPLQPHIRLNLLTYPKIDKNG